MAGRDGGGAMGIPGGGASWFKAHGLGNDYLVFRSGDAWKLSPEAVAAVCHRWEGVGSDGIVLELPAERGVFRLRMFNPDGSEFERSGNGLRVFGAALASAGRIGDEPFEVEVGGGRVTMQLHGRGEGGEFDLSVGMGEASVDPERVGMELAHLLPPAVGAGGTGTLALADGESVRIRAVWVGNPHCVVFTDDLSEEALHRLGPALTRHPAFPRGTNVQLARVEQGPGEGSGGALRIAIWERGVGRTSASGTSSCAVAVAAVAEGRLPPGEIEVRMEGGVLGVTVTPELDVVLRGPVREVTRGVLTPGYLEALSRLG